MSDFQIDDLSDSVAIIGMAGRFPGAVNIEHFWENLKNGVESISFFSDQELAEFGVEKSLLTNPKYVKAKGVLRDADMFDGAFFGFAPREAETTDPQHRVFLECAWEALENAGCDPESFGGAIGVFAGVSLPTYLLMNMFANRELMDGMGILQASIRNRTDHLATRASYKLNLSGPSVTVQTACSTSLVAVHMACRSLASYECDVALAGGITISVPQISGYLYREGGIISPDGHCRAFDHKAQGTVSGNGTGVVVLKRLADAVADRDFIRAVIRGSAINNDGSSKVGYTAPSVEGQARVIAMAQAVAGVAPETITYIETHGTGTPMGDPIEVKALTQVFRERAEGREFCAIGSVKTNIGHLDAAAGVAGLIKTVLALEHKQIPPSLNFERPNPLIDFADSPFYVNASLAEWESGATPRRAGVSSFGIGGTNAHVILEEAPAREPSKTIQRSRLVVLSARSRTALEQATSNLADYLKKNPDVNLADVAYTLQKGRRAFGYRRAIVCWDVPDAVAALEMLDTKRVFTGSQEAFERPVAFMFSGQGAQRVNMGAKLYELEPGFRGNIDLCCEALKLYLGFDLREAIYPSEEQIGKATELLNQTYITQPALFVVEYALAQLWMEYGVIPQALIGHSIGEYVAACLAGVFSLGDALRLVAARGRLMQGLPKGAMLSVSLSEEDSSRLLGNGLSLAAVNSPSLCVLAGPEPDIEELEHKLVERGVSCKRLRTSHAFHSSMMEPILAQFTAEVSKINLSPPQIPYISNLTGTWITASQATDPGYWVKHLRSTVRFSDGVSELFKDPHQLLLEVGPGRALMTIARWHQEKPAGQTVLASLPDGSADDEALLSALGRMWISGARVEWSGLNKREEVQRVPLPSYPFERKRYWVEPEKETGGQRAKRPLSKRQDITEWFYAPSWKRSVPVESYELDRAQKRSCAWLLFADEYGFGKRIAAHLRSREQPVITVSAGRQFDRIAEDHYTIDPARSADYQALLNDLANEQRIPDFIAHLWGVSDAEAESRQFKRWEEDLDLSFYSLMFLAQAIGSVGLSSRVHLSVVANGIAEVTGDEKLFPLKATALGPGRVIPQEYENVTCRAIDIPLPVPFSVAEQKLIESLVAEMSLRAGDPFVAYRGNHRWTRTFETIQLPEAPDPSTRLRERGVYVITGGLGGVGLVLADYLARAVKAKLVLIGRSSFPDPSNWSDWLASHGADDPTSRKIRKLQELEAAGAEVSVISADVCDYEQMSYSLTAVRERLGTINGIIHAAGIAGGGMIQFRTPEVARGVLDPKVSGTQVIASLAEGVDFIALCSSRASILGGFGGVDYCAANAFLDAFAPYHSSRSGIFTVSINWPAWNEVGMLVDTAAQFGFSPNGAGPEYKEGEHPFLRRFAVEGEGKVVYLSEFSVATHWVLDEHRIIRNAVAPGVTYLEMARAAFEQYTGGQAVEIRDIFFLAPMHVQDNETREVRLTLERKGEEFEFRVASRSAASENDTWQEHAIGKVASAGPQPERMHDLREIISRCGLNDLIITDEDRDPDLGPRWQNIKRVYLGEGELLALLELPDGYDSDLEVFKLHPALMDRAAGTGMLYLVQDRPYMPFSYKRLSVSHAFPRRVYTYIRHIEGGYSRKETVSFDVTIMDENGLELARVEEFSEKKINDPAMRLRARAIAQTTQAVADEERGTTSQDNPYARSLSEGLTPPEGADAFARILSGYSLPQIVVSTVDLFYSIEQSSAPVKTRVEEEVSKIEVARPSHPRPELQNEYIAPRNRVEQIIAGVWQDLLGISQIGADDNFFELGGDSVLAIQIISRINQSGFQLAPQQLFQFQTVAELAAVAAKDDKAGEELVALTPAQRRFLEEAHLFSRSIILPLCESVDDALLQQAVEMLISRHEALRSRFEHAHTGWKQWIAPQENRSMFSRIDLSSLEPDEQQFAIEVRLSELEQKIDILEGPILQAALLDLGQSGPHLLIMVHTLAADAFSMRLMLEDLESAYSELLGQGPAQPPSNGSSFKAWAERAQSQEADYSRGALAINEAKLLIDYESGENTAESSEVVWSSLSDQETRALLEDVTRAFRAQIEEVLVAALARALANWKGSPSVFIHLEWDGRASPFGELEMERTVGPLNLLSPVSLEINTAEGPGESLRIVKQQLRSILYRGIGNNATRYSSEGEADVEAFSPEVRFGFAGQIGPATSSLFAPDIGLFKERRPPSARRTHLLEADALVRKGQLQVCWTFSRNLHKPDTIKELARQFVAELNSIIVSSLTPQERSYRPSDFPLARLSEQSLRRLSVTLDRAEDVYTLSPMQRGLLFHTLLAPRSGMYVEHLSWVIEGPLDLATLARAWQQVLERQPVLRTAFAWEGLDEPHQIVERQVTMPLTTLDWRGIGEEEAKYRLEEFLQADRGQGFDLLKAPLMRFALMQLAENSYQAVWSFHHIIMDGWSVPVVLKELFLSYEALSSGREEKATPNRFYKSFIAWLQQQSPAKAEQFWRDQLKGFAEPVLLSAEQPGGGPEHGEDYGEQNVKLSAEMTEAIRSFGRQHQLTPNTILQGAWTLLLSWYSGRDDVVFGSVVSGRSCDLPGLETMIGVFINTLPMRVRLDWNESVSSWLRNIQARQTEISRYEYTPLVQVQEWSEAPRGMPLFESIVVFENHPTDSAFDNQGGRVKISRMRHYYTRTNYPLTVVAEPGRELVVVITYDNRRFAASTVAQLGAHLENLLAEIVSGAERRLGDVTPLGEAERRSLEQWNATTVDYRSLGLYSEAANTAQELCALQLFELQAARAPESVAAVCEGQRISYGDLNRAANRVARSLIEMGVGQDVLVAILADRGVEFLILMLATFKAGGAYLPLDPRHPPRRINQVFEQSRAPVLLASRKYAGRVSDLLAQGGHALIEIEQLLGCDKPEENLPIRCSPQSLAYVIYTSGSTGAPKGAMIEHKGMLNHLCAKIIELGLTDSDTIAQTASQCFDISVWQFLAALMVGGTVHIFPDEVVYDPLALLSRIADDRVTIFEAVPSMLAAMLDANSPPDLSALRWLIPTGEALPPELCRKWLERIPCTPMLNAYGPTECSDDVTHYRICTPPSESTVRIPIGRPVANMRLYVLNKRMQPVPTGLAGELWVGGAGVGRGYLHDPERTAEVFAPDPFSQEPGARLYNTGDLARLLPEGDLEFLGRVDQQVKIRGFRIELGEIGSVLRQHPAVKDAVVIARNNRLGETSLVAFLVLEDVGVSASELHLFLKERLPDYMLPSSINFLPAIPLTPNGKVDRLALAAFEDAEEASKESFVAPRTPTERALADIWKQVLGLEQMGVDDNFFDLGGHSLLATQVTHRVGERLGVELSLRALFESPTIAGLTVELVQSQARQTSIDELAQILAEVEALSEAEAQSMVGH